MKSPRKEIVYFAFNEGGLGDNIARLSAIDYCVKNYNWVEPRLLVPEYFKGITQQQFPTIWVRTFEEFERTHKLMPVTMVRSDIPQCSIIRHHLVEQAFNTMLDVKPEKEAYDYVKLNLSDVDVSQFNLPEKYAVMTCMYTAKVREFPPQVVNEISDFLKETGITPVFLGKEEAKAGNHHTIKGKTEVNMDQGLNLLNKTSLLEAAKIMQSSQCVIGLDNGLLHLAATTDAHIVAGFTTVDPLHRRPQRNGVEGWRFHEVTPELDCKFCQSKLNFVYDVLFTKCFQHHMKCVKEMKADPYINQIKKILDI
jgi:ADP-heptose:LPS heptosyltransferase